MMLTSQLNTTEIYFLLYFSIRQQPLIYSLSVLMTFVNVTVMMDIHSGVISAGIWLMRKYREVVSFHHGPKRMDSLKHQSISGSPSTTFTGHGIKNA